MKKIKCWAIQKLIPLFIQKDDSSLGHNHFFQHISCCPSCEKAYQTFQRPFTLLKKNRQLELPEELFEGYWDEIYSEITSKHKAIRYKPGWSLRPMLKPAFIAVAGVLLCMFLLFQDNSLIHQKISISGIRHPIPSRNVKKMLDKKILTNLPCIVKEPNTILLKNSNDSETVEYQLDQVMPLNSKDASF